MSSLKTLGALRQLAVLGLPGRSLVPEMIGLLNRLAGFELWGLRFMDSRFRLIDGFASAELPTSLIQDFAENFHDRECGGEEGVTASSAMRSGQKVILTSRLVDQKKLERTAFWDRIARPTRMAMPAQMPLHLGGRHTAFAVLVMGRTFGSADFSPATVRMLEEAQPWLCHMLRQPERDEGQPDHPSFPTGDAGILILDASGRIESASPGAQNLLLCATGAGLSPSSLRHALRNDAGELLKQLAASVGGNTHGKPASPPSGTLHNRYGTFKLRAYALNAFASGEAMSISLHIERLAPASQRLFSAPRFINLPNRQREVALCLVQGRSHTQTAERLGIKPSSVIHATRELYQRLDIDSRDKLLTALLAS